MPHTTTKNRRNKRDDTRPNAKFRMKTFKKLDKLTKIQDLRVTRINSKDRKERIVTAAASAKQLSNDEKRLRSLRKKLNTIIELQEKQEAGTTLDAQQLTKLASLDDCVSEISRLVEKTSKKSIAYKKKHNKNNNSDDNSEEEEMDEDDDEEEESEEEEESDEAEE